MSLLQSPDILDLDHAEHVVSGHDDIKFEDVSEHSDTEPARSVIRVRPAPQQDSSSHGETQDREEAGDGFDVLENMRDFLALQFKHIHTVLKQSSDTTLRFAGQQDMKASDLQAEVERLRSRLAVIGVGEAAGTGESSSSIKEPHRYYQRVDLGLSKPPTATLHVPTEHYGDVAAGGHLSVVPVGNALVSEQLHTSDDVYTANPDTLAVHQSYSYLSSQGGAGRNALRHPRPSEESHVEKVRSSRMMHGNQHFFSNEGKVMHEEEIQEEEQQQQPAQLPQAVFADAAAMKEKVRQAIGKPEYNVHDFYKTEGWFQRIARHPYFEYFTLGVIAMNSLWISIDTDHNKESVLMDAHAVFQVAENLFCSYFFSEWIVRFCAFKCKKDCFRDMWFIFDTLLVAFMVVETWIISAIILMTGSAGSGQGVGNAGILRLVRLLRLTRMARMARLLRAMPELMIMVKGMVVASRSVFFTLCLLVMFLYIFAIAFTQLTTDSDVGDEYFKSVPDSMLYLLLHGTLLEDSPDFVIACGRHSYFLGALVLLFILLASLTVMNMLVGVLVEVVSVVSAVEKEQLVVNFVQSQLLKMMQISGLDANNDHMISRDEFESLLENPVAARALQEVGVDVVGLVDFTDFIFKDGNDISFPDFMECVLQLRGSNIATVKDIVDLRKCLLTTIDHVADLLDVHTKRVAGITRSMTLGNGGLPLQGSAKAKLSTHSALSTYSAS